MILQFNEQIKRNKYTLNIRKTGLGIIKYAFNFCNSKEINDNLLVDLQEYGIEYDDVIKLFFDKIKPIVISNQDATVNLSIEELFILLYFVSQEMFKLDIDCDSVTGTSFGEAGYMILSLTNILQKTNKTQLSENIQKNRTKYTKNVLRVLNNFNTLLYEDIYSGNCSLSHTQQQELINAFDLKEVILSLASKLKIIKSNNKFDEVLLKQYLENKSINKLPGDFDVFLKKYNGGTAIDVVNIREYQYQNFLGFGYSDDVVNKELSIFDKDFIPIINDIENNYFLMSFRKYEIGSIYFWYYDEVINKKNDVETFQNSLIRIAPSFTKFIIESEIIDDFKEDSAKVFIRRGQIDMLEKWLQSKWRLKDDKIKNEYGQNLVKYTATQNQIEILKLLAKYDVPGFNETLKDKNVISQCNRETISTLKQLT